MNIKTKIISTMIHTSWVILLLTLFYYFFIEKIETHVAQSGIEYLIDSVVNAVRPGVMTIPHEQRKTIKFNHTPVKPEKRKEKPKKFFEGSYGKMRIIMITITCLLGSSLIYFFYSKQQKYIYLNLTALTIAFFVVFTEYFFANVVTPKFYSIDSNKTLSYIFGYLEEKVK